MLRNVKIYARKEGIVLDECQGNVTLSFQHAAVFKISGLVCPSKWV